MSKDELNTSNRQEAEQGKVILEDDSLLSKGFTQVPNTVLRDPSLSDGAKLTYAMLLSYAWSDNSSFPGQERLATDLGKESRSVRRHLTELKEKGLIRVERRGMGKTNIYYVKTNFEADRTKMSYQERTKMSYQERTKMSDKEYSSKNTQIKNTKISNNARARNTIRKAKPDKIFRETNVSKTKKGGDEGTTSARSHIAPPTTRNQKAEAEMREQKGRGVTFSPNEEGTTNKRDVQGRTQQVTPTSMVLKSVPENTGRSTNVPPLTTKQTPTQKRIVKNGASKQPAPAYVGKPLTQEEIDEKRRRGLNASGFTPLAGIIPASHWQELETKASTQLHNGNGSSNGNGNHYHTTTKNAPLSIDATMEQLTKILNDEPENTAQNINRAAKLCKQVGYDSDQFANLLWSIYHEIKKKPDKLFKTRRADGRANKMPVFFTELEKALGFKPKHPN